MESPRSLDRGIPPRHVRRPGLLGGVGRRHLLLIVQLYIAILPISGTPFHVATPFFQSYLALSVVALFYIVEYAWKKTTLQRAHQIDLDVIVS
jgi:amino acid permease